MRIHEIGLDVERRLAGYTDEEYCSSGVPAWNPLRDNMALSKKYVFDEKWFGTFGYNPGKTPYVTAFSVRGVRSLAYAHLCPDGYEVVKAHGLGMFAAAFVVPVTFPMMAPAITAPAIAVGTLQSVVSIYNPLWTHHFIQTDATNVDVNNGFDIEAYISGSSATRVIPIHKLAEKLDQVASSPGKASVIGLETADHINGVDDRKAPAGIQHGKTEYVFARMAELADIPGGSMRVRGVVNNLGGTLSPMLAASLCIGKSPVVIDVIGGLSNTASALFGGSVIAAKMPRDAVREMESAFYAAQAASMDVSHFEAREGEILAGHNLVAQEFAMAIDSIVSSGGFTPTMRLVDYLGSGDAAFDDMRVGASISKVSAEDLDDNPPRRSDVLVAFK